MPVSIVKLLKVVDIHEGERKLPPVPRRALEFPVEDALETSPVEQAGEAVSDGLLLDPGVGPGMMDSDGREGAKNIKRLEQGSGKFSQGKAIDVKNADDLMGVDEGDVNEGLGALMTATGFVKKDLFVLLLMMVMVRDFKIRAVSPPRRTFHSRFALKSFGNPLCA